jgi:hypothetical protein
MATQHPVFLRPVEGDKILVVTVLDREALPEVSRDDKFVIATTERNALTLGNPTMTLNLTTLLHTDKYVEAVRKAHGDNFIQSTRGMGIGGIATGPYWFNKKVTTLTEQLYF